MILFRVRRLFFIFRVDLDGGLFVFKSLDNMLYVGIDVYKIADKRVLWVLKIGEVGVWERNSQNDDR